MPLGKGFLASDARKRYCKGRGRGLTLQEQEYPGVPDLFFAFFMSSCKQNSTGALLRA